MTSLETAETESGGTEAYQHALLWASAALEMEIKKGKHALESRVVLH